MSLPIQIRQCLLLATLLLNSVPGYAHETLENNARIILRDGHVEVRLMVELSRWQAVLQDHHAWLLGDIDRVIPKNQSDQQLQALLKTVLIQNTTMAINDNLVPLSVASFLGTPMQHDRFSEIVLSAKHSESNPAKVSIRFPKSLGSILTSIVRPKYSMTNAGETVEYSFSSMPYKISTPTSPP